MNRTWTLVPPPSDHRVIGCKWVYKIKLRADGALERCKARLVAKGFHQEEGIDYTETLSTVIRPTTIRVVLTLSLSQGWSIRKLDVHNAFLHGDLKETVYMAQPPSFVLPNRIMYVCSLSRFMVSSNPRHKGFISSVLLSLLLVFALLLATPLF
jgi:histone deacetylase 1/2